MRNIQAAAYTLLLVLAMVAVFAAASLATGNPSFDIAWHIMVALAQFLGAALAVMVIWKTG